MPPADSEVATPATPAPAPVAAPQRPVVARDPVTGGITDTLSIANVLKLYGMMKDEEWNPRPGRYYFSGLATCFRKAFYKGKNDIAEHAALLKGDGAAAKLPFPEEPGHEYMTGDAEAGNGVEERLLKILREIYGDEGTVLKNIRFSRVIKTGAKTADGKDEEIAFVGRTDPLIVGDNFQPLDFMELKSWKYVPKKAEILISTFPEKEVPFFLAGVNTPDHPNGLANINNAVQLAIGVKFLMDRGLEPRKKRLTYMGRSTWEDHISLLLSGRDVEILYDLAEFWVLEHHANLKEEKPPAPRWFMSYECTYCPFQRRCAKDGGKKEVHPVMLGFNERIKTANSGSTA